MVREFLFGIGLSIAVMVVASQSNDAQLVAWAIPAIVLIWVTLFGWLGLKKLDTGYTLTNQRLLHEKGILYRRTRRIEAIDIADLSFEQGIVERLIDVGRIRVDASDVSDRSLVLRGISRPKKVYELLEQARRGERLRWKPATASPYPRTHGL